jgi:membrane-associated phospholipid phosphatase
VPEAGWRPVPSSSVATTIAETITETLDRPPEVRPVESPLATALPPEPASAVQRFDRAADAWFDRLRGNSTADRFFYGASALGDFSLLWHLVSVGRTVLRPDTDREAVRLAVCLAAESVIINVGVKSFFRRDRPTFEGARPRRLRQPRSSSFPSGHATSAFMTAALLADGRRHQRPAWLALAAAVSASRVHVRIHHASDVVGGAVIGSIAGLAIRRAWPVRAARS